jgi:membrane-associated protease RseP (regulator of RpoE activity)
MVSARWVAPAVASLVVLAWWAPSGLALLGFLAVVILTHETGHLVAARRVGMRPTEYFWGFGPDLVAVRRGDCRYGVKALFLGGYVKLEGMTPSSELPAGFDERGTFRAARPGDRLVTILAGPVVNLVLAGAAFSIATALEGADPGRVVLSGPVDVWFIAKGTGAALWIWISDLGGYLAAVLDPSGATEAPVRFLSPVGQARITGWAVGSGPVAMLRWFGVLSCAVGVVNLLPLPPLDGSHALAALVEWLMGRLRPGRVVRFDVSRLLPLAYVTVTALVALSVTALVLDIRDLA